MSTNGFNGGKRNVKKLLTITCAAAALAIPAAASGANDPATNASKFCKQLAAASGGKHSDGFAAAVRTMFPDARNVTKRNAHGKCVSAKTKENESEAAKAEKQGKKNAAKTC